MEKLLHIGLILIFIGIIFVFISSLALAPSEKSKVAVGGFIGPIPFGFFSSKKMFFIWLALFTVGLTIWLSLKYF